MTGYAFAISACILLVVMLVVLLRTRRLREKYAVLWIGVAVGICILGAFPSLALTIATLVGVSTPSNLLFALALLVLLLVCVQLSVEVTGLEEETRTLVEEVALLRFDLERHMAEHADADPTGSPVTDLTSVALPADSDPDLGAEQR